MATATTDEVEDIRRRMAWIRHELHQDVRGVVQSAEAVTDWKHYFRDYPWASVAAAAALGFWLVPKRRKSVKPHEVAKAVVAEIQPAMQQAVAAEPVKEEKKSRGLIGAALGLLAPIAMKAAQNYATHYVTSWIAQQQADMAERMMAASEGPPPGSDGPRPEQRYSGGMR